MVIFKLLTDMVANAGILLFVWHMVKVARVLSEPDPEGVDKIVCALKRLQVTTERMSSRLSKVVPFPTTESQQDSTEAENG